MGPINYLAAMPQEDFLRDIQGGLQLGSVFQSNRLKQQELAAKLAARQAYQEGVSAFLANPTPKGALELGMRFPDQHAAIKDMYSALSTEQQQSEMKDTGELLAMLHTGNTELAQQRLQQRADMMKNAGQDPAPVLSLLDMVRRDPKQAYAYALHAAAGMPGGDKLLANLSAVGTETRAAAEAPAKLRQATAQATTAEVEAQNAPETARLNLEKLRAEIAADVQKAEGSGGLDPEKRFDFELKLRKEYSTQTSGYQEVREAYERINASEDNAVGDLSLIFGYMKMLDPGSVVREGEFATAQNAAGVPERVLNIYNKVLSGERLSAGQRSTFRGQAKGLLDAAAKREKTVRAGIDQVVKSYRLNPDNVFYEPGEAPAQPGKPGQQPAAAVPGKYQGRKWTQY